MPANDSAPPAARAPKPVDLSADSPLAAVAPWAIQPLADDRARRAAAATAEDAQAGPAE
jgi:hypothetical protein